jgi:hypothetical protein
VALVQQRADGRVDRDKTEKVTIPSQYARASSAKDPARIRKVRPTAILGGVSVQRHCDGHGYAGDVCGGRRPLAHAASEMPELRVQLVRESYESSRPPLDERRPTSLPRPWSLVSVNATKEGGLAFCSTAWRCPSRLAGTTAGCGSRTGERGRSSRLIWRATATWSEKAQMDSARRRTGFQTDACSSRARNSSGSSPTGRASRTRTCATSHRSAGDHRRRARHRLRQHDQLRLRRVQ